MRRGKGKATSFPVWQGPISMRNGVRLWDKNRATPERQCHRNFFQGKYCTGTIAPIVCRQSNSDCTAASTHWDNRQGPPWKENVRNVIEWSGIACSCSQGNWERKRLWLGIRRLSQSIRIFAVPCLDSFNLWFDDGTLIEQLADHKVEVSKSEAAHLRFFQPSKTTDTQTSWNVAYVRSEK